MARLGRIVGRTSITEFVADRLGDFDDPLVQLRMMVLRVFGSASYTDFWR